MVQHKLVWNLLSLDADEFVAFSGQRRAEVKILNVNCEPLFVVRDVEWSRSLTTSRLAVGAETS